MAYLLIIIKLITASLILAIDHIKKKQQKKWGRMIIYIIVLTLFFDAFISFYIGYSSDKKNNETYLLAKCMSNSGHIKSFKKSKSKYPNLVTGSGKKAHYKWEGKKEKPFFKLSGENIYIEMIDGAASISFDLRNKEGKLIGYIINNEWHISRNEVLDVNYTQDTLEIIDKDNEIFLQLKIKGDSVWLAGTFYGKYPSRQRFELRPWLRSGSDWDARIFKYPSCKHYGDKKT